MTAYSRGDVVPVGFVFAEGSGKKFRPALVISTPAYHRGRQEVVAVAITSNIRRRLFDDYLITDWKEAGLLFPSVATGILRTIKRAMIGRKLGSLAKADLEAIDRQLGRCLGL